MRLTSVLALHHADQVLPCADFFNPGWEVEIGTSQGTLEHRNKFRRKVDPVVNGITDMQVRFFFFSLSRRDANLETEICSSVSNHL
jgi:hypothetical protein